MRGSSVAISVKLEAATRQKGDVWLAWCPAIDVITQAETKERALESLREAVELWFESCIARNVLDQALLEARFHKAKAGEMLPDNANIVEVHQPKTAPADGYTTTRDYIEVSIPAYIAAQCSADNLRAPR